MGSSIVILFWPFFALGALLADFGLLDPLYKWLGTGGFEQIQQFIESFIESLGQLIDM